MRRAAFYLDSLVPLAVAPAVAQKGLLLRVVAWGGDDQGVLLVDKGKVIELYNELLCQHKKIHRFKVYKLYSLFIFQFIALEGFIHFIRYTVI